MKKKRVILLLLGLSFLLSLAAVFYPLVSNMQAEKQRDAIVLSYQEAVHSNGAAQEALSLAREYNYALANGQFAETDYNALLDPSHTGMMGFVTIPAINVDLPIYHGTQSLELGAVHLQGTSLPVGGESSHCVISAHSGMSSQKMFTDLDQLAVGDVFCLTVYGEKLSYQVDRILTVLPKETEFLQIEAGKDYCTLLTCTPYGVNTHRLLVRGHRIETTEESTIPDAPRKQSTWMQEYLRGIVYGVGIVAIVTVVILTAHLILKRRKQKCVGK